MEPTLAERAPVAPDHTATQPLAEPVSEHRPGICPSLEAGLADCVTDDSLFWQYYWAITGQQTNAVQATS